jgi:acetolactate synthase-1/2/3 large subunit
MIAHDGPVVMDVAVKKDENCYPMVAPGKSNAQMLGLPEVPVRTKTNQLTECDVCHTQNPVSHRFCSGCGAKL